MTAWFKTVFTGAASQECSGKAFWPITEQTRTAEWRLAIRQVKIISAMWKMKPVQQVWVHAAIIQCGFSRRTVLFCPVHTWTWPWCNGGLRCNGTRTRPVVGDDIILPKACESEWLSLKNIHWQLWAFRLSPYKCVTSCLFFHQQNASLEDIVQVSHTWLWCRRFCFVTN